MNSADSLLAEAPMEDSALSDPVKSETRPNPNHSSSSQGLSSNVTPLNSVQKPLSLRDCVAQSMENYFQHLDGQPVSEVYAMVLAEVEAPLLEVVMKYTRHNQTQASQVLGLNRGTLRKKLKQYGLI